MLVVSIQKSLEQQNSESFGCRGVLVSGVGLITNVTLKMIDTKAHSDLENDRHITLNGPIREELNQFKSNYSC